MPESPAPAEPVEIDTPPLRLPDGVASAMLPLCSALPLVIDTEPPSVEPLEPAVTDTEPEPDADDPTDTVTPPALEVLASPVESAMAPFAVVAEMSPPLDSTIRPLLPLDTDTSEPDDTDTEPPAPDWDLPADNRMEPLCDDEESPVDTLTDPLLCLLLAPLDSVTDPLTSAPLALAIDTLPLDTAPLPLIKRMCPPLAFADDPPDTSMSAPSPEPDTPMDNFRAPAEPPLLSPVLNVTPPV